MAQLTSTSVVATSINSSTFFSFSSSAIASSSVLGQKSPSKYGTSFAVAKPAINASAAMSLHSRPHTGSRYYRNKLARLHMYRFSSKMSERTLHRVLAIFTGETGVLLMLSLPITNARHLHLAQDEYGH